MEQFIPDQTALAPYDQSDPQQVAIWLHKLGCNVVAMKPGSAASYAPTWTDRRNNRFDEQATRREFIKYSSGNYGVAQPGILLDDQSRIIMLDCDGEDAAAVATVLQQYELTSTLTVPARRGKHFYYRLPEGVAYPRGSWELEEGEGREVELKVNTLTPMPPQTHRKHRDFAYTFAADTAWEIAEAPPLLVKRILERAAHEAAQQAEQHGKPGAAWALVLRAVVDGGYLDPERVRFAGSWRHDGTRAMFCLSPEEHKGGELERPSAYLITRDGAGLRCQYDGHNLPVLDLLMKVWALQTPRDVKGRLTALGIDFPANFNPDGKPALQANGGDSYNTAKAALQILSEANQESPRLLKSADGIVRIEQNEEATLTVLNAIALRVEYARYISWYAETDHGNRKAAKSPKEVAEDTLTLPWAEIPLHSFKGRIYTPTFTANGTLHAEPGYDRETGLYFSAKAGYVAPEFPANPSDADIAAAVALYKDDLLADFPFENPADFANALALALLPIVRPMIAGCVPQTMVLAPEARTGKGKLLELLLNCSMPAERSIAPAAWLSEETELEKRLLGIFKGGQPIHIWDNIDDEMRSPVYAMALTARRFSGRVLGATGQVEVENRTIFAATANNATMHRDIALRTVPVHLNARMENPGERTDWRHPDVVTWARENSEALLAARLTLVQAWLQRGRPGAAPSTPIMGGFEEWRDIIGGVLQVARVPDFLANLNRITTNNDPETEAERAFFKLWFARFGSRPVTSENVAACAQATGFNAGSGHPDGYVKRLGKRLSKLSQQGVIRGELCLMRHSTNARNGVGLYYLKRNDAPTSKQVSNGDEF